MYKMNILLKFIFVILTISIVVITNNRIELWLMLLLLSIYNLHKNKKISIFVDLLLVLLLGFSTNYEICLLLFKILFIINFIITIFNSLSLEEKKLLVRENTSSKLDFYEENFDRIVKNINERKMNIYDEGVSIDNRIERDLERSYLQSKIRFNNSNKNNYYKWNKIDSLFLLFFIVVFVILFILR